MAQKSRTKKYLAKLLTSNRKTAADLEEYQYRGLDVARKELRLVLVVPARDEQEPIQAVLVHASLESSPPPAYETVSYVWGSPKQRAPLTLDETCIAAPASSVAALRRLRKPESPRTLWIDAICIDQTNNVERAQQVAIMSEIYSNSDGNLIYLGEGDQKSIMALRDMHLVLKDMYRETSGLSSVGVKDTVLDRDRISGGYASHGFQSDVDFDRLVTFFALPWFR